MRNLFAAGIASALMAGAAFADGLAITVDGEAQGTIKIDLAEDVAPAHVARLKELATSGAYDGVVFHRVIDGFRRRPVMSSSARPAATQAVRVWADQICQTCPLNSRTSLLTVALLAWHAAKALTLRTRSSSSFLTKGTS